MNDDFSNDLDGAAAFAGRWAEPPALPEFDPPDEAGPSRDSLDIRQGLRMGFAFGAAELDGLDVNWEFLVEELALIDLELRLAEYCGRVIRAWTTPLVAR